MAKLKVFYAHSWEPPEEQEFNKSLEDYFRYIFSLENIELVTAKRVRSSENPRDKYKRLIKESHGLCAVLLSERPGVKMELNIAKELNIPIMILKEKKCSLDFIRELKDKTDIIEFDQKKFFLILIEVDTFLKDIKQRIKQEESIRKFNPKIMKYYKRIEEIEDVIISKNGHGILTYSDKIEVLSDKFNAGGFYIGFGIDNLTLEHQKLKPFEKMRSNEKRATNQTFFLYSEEKNHLSCITDKENEKELLVAFPNDKFKKGDTIEIKWGWSCPFLFHNIEQIRETGNGIISTFVPNSRIKKVIDILHIEKGHPLSKKIIEYEVWVNNDLKLKTIPVRRIGDLYKVELQDVIPKHKYRLTFRNE